MITLGHYILYIVTCTQTPIHLHVSCPPLFFVTIMWCLGHNYNYCPIALSESLNPTPRGLQASTLLAERFCCLQSAHSTCAFAVPYLPPEALTINTPLNVSAWSSALESHPNQPWAQPLVEGLRTGVRIGYNPARKFKRARENCRSARDHPYIVADYLTSELAHKRVAGPFEDNLVGVMVSRFGVIPKSSKPGHWRLIVDLSAPASASVNDGISSADSGMAYSTVHDAARMVLQLGPGTEMAKIDIASAFRLIPVHPDDRYLLGMRWNNQVYIDKQLPFGLRSAPVLFNAYADALEWIIRTAGVTHILHYLDDFLVLGAPGSGRCKAALDSMIATCRSLGVPLADDKIAGPATSLVFLGIELDTIRMEARLPDDKLKKLTQELQTWAARKCCKRKDLEHLLGVLNFACTVLPAGRSFLRRMFTLLHTVRDPNRFIRLNAEFRSDLAWWIAFTRAWNGISFLRLSGLAEPTVVFYTDASGAWGCGAIWDTMWFQGQWPSGWSDTSIMVKELVPIVCAAAVWGPSWAGQHVRCYCDNMSVVASLIKGSSREPSGVVMHLLRTLTFFSASFRFTLQAKHVAGAANGPADSLSRNNMPSFFSQVPLASKEASRIPDDLWALLVLEQPDWLSERWRTLFCSFFRTVSPPPHRGVINLVNAASCPSANK